MSTSNQRKKFNKDQPGADLEFMPSYIDEYRDDPWDIRISIGDAPVEEAFYFTVNDPSAVNKSIKSLLNEYALNPRLSRQLAVDDYPDLPFMQQELIQYMNNQQAGRLKLSLYINKNPVPGPVGIEQSAIKFLSACTYHDETHDYRLLDLILVPELLDMDAGVLEKWHEEYRTIYLLLLLDFQNRRGENKHREFLSSPRIQTIFEDTENTVEPEFIQGMQALTQMNYIKVFPYPVAEGASGKAVMVDFTLEGREEVESLKKESAAIAEKYDSFDSVAVAPPALGVPDGFDVRIQMMELDGVQYERAVLLRILDETEEDLFGSPDWCDVFESKEYLKILHQALSYKTCFSREILESIKEVAPGSP